MLRFLSSEQFWEQYSKNFTILIIRTIFILVEQFNGFLSFKRLTTKSILVKIIFHIYVDLKHSVQNSSWKNSANKYRSELRHFLCNYNELNQTVRKRPYFV